MGPRRGRRPIRGRRRRSLGCLAVAAVGALAAPACGAGAPAAGSGPALAAARALTAPSAALQKNGEFEGWEFWEEHDELLSRAWQELGPRNGALYSYGPGFERRYLHRDLREAADAARNGQGEGLARSLFREFVPGVYASDRLFTEDFRRDLLGELEHVEGSGIPKRRPNGMNRFGVILDQVGLRAAMEGLVAAHVRPLAAMLFPELVGAGDADDHYAFTVRYEAAGDTELAKHADASVATLNLCLGQPGWGGGALRFFDSGGSGIYALPKGNSSAGAGDVDFSPGIAVLHRGQHKHQALPLTSGQRTNVIIWLFGRDGVVRAAPYARHEQLSAWQRWGSAERQPLADL